MLDLGLIEVDEQTAIDVRYGRVMEAARIEATGSGPYPLVDSAGELLAVYVPHKGGTIKPAVVLAEPPPPNPAR